MALRRRSPSSAFYQLCRIAAAASFLPAVYGQMGGSSLSTDRDIEINSPTSCCRGRRARVVYRAVPQMQAEEQQTLGQGFTQFNRFTDILQNPEFELNSPPDPSTFRQVIVNLPPVGLHPRIYRDGLFEVYPWFGLLQSFESNINLTSIKPISDFYITPQAGLEFRLGTPDSFYTPMYNTIFALRGEYTAYAVSFMNIPS